jgi:uncharacterized protein YxeA
MKKLIYLIVIVIVLIVGFFVYRKISIQNKFKNDETYVRETMLQKDSEGRGFSDIVKTQIDSEFKDPEVRKMIYEFSKNMRLVVLSNSESEFIAFSRYLILSQSCMYFIMNEKKLDSALMTKVTKTIALDNDEMYQYYDYLSLVRFNRVASKLASIINDPNTQVDSLVEYQRKCLK